MQIDVRICNIWNPNIHIQMLAIDQFKCIILWVSPCNFFIYLFADCKTYKRFKLSWSTRKLYIPNSEVRKNISYHLMNNAYLHLEFWFVTSVESLFISSKFLYSFLSILMQTNAQIEQHRLGSSLKPRPFLVQDLGHGQHQKFQCLQFWESMKERSTSTRGICRIPGL